MTSSETVFDFLANNGSKLVPLEITQGKMPEMPSQVVTNAEFDVFGAWQAEEAEIRGGIVGLSTKFKLSKESVDKLKALFVHTSPGRVSSRSMDYYWWHRTPKEDGDRLLVDQLTGLNVVVNDMYSGGIAERQDQLSTGERKVILALSDNLRDVSLRLYSGVQRAELFTGKPNRASSYLERMCGAAIDSYYSILLQKPIAFEEIAGALEACLTLLKTNQLEQAVRYAPKNLREFDHPATLVGWTHHVAEQIGNQIPFDVAVEFPQGSLGMGVSMNCVSQALTGRPLTKSVVDCHFSGYRNRSDELFLTVPSSQHGRLTQASRKFLVLDDNLVSGSTLLVARQQIQKEFPESQVACVAAQVYRQGLETWYQGDYQFIAKSEIAELVADFRLEPQVSDKLFRDSEKQGIFHTDNQGRKMHHVWEWKANLTDADFASLSDLGVPDQIIVKLKTKYGFHAYSSLAWGAIHLLGAHPVGFLEMDEFDVYIKDRLLRTTMQ